MTSHNGDNDPSKHSSSQTGDSGKKPIDPIESEIPLMPKIDHNHPLYLHPSDTAGLNLVSEKLTSIDDYGYWSKAMRICLISKNKLGFITGSCKKENFDPNLHDQWERCNALVLAWIMNSVSRELMSGNIYTENALMVWNDLKDRMHKVNGSRIFQLHREICLAQQGVDTISAYFARLRTLWEEFDAICNLPNCGCPEFQKHITHGNNLKLFQFLNGLNDSYSQVRTNLVMRESLPTVSQAYAVLVQEENQRGISGSISANVTSDARSSYTSDGKPKQKTGQKRKWDLVCEFCKGKGHDFDHCFERKGYPPGWKSRRNQGQGRTPQANSAVDGNFVNSGHESGGSGVATPLDLPKSQPMMVTTEMLEHMARTMMKTQQSEADAHANVVANAAGSLQWNGVGDWS